MTAPRPRLRRREAAAYLLERHGVPIAVATLAKLASIGGGPVLQYYGRIPLYGLAELDDWAAERLSPRVRSTSERNALADRVTG